MNAYYESGEDSAKGLFGNGVFHVFKRCFPKGVILVHEGDEGDSFYIIERGKVKVFGNDKEGNEVIFSVKGPGTYFGEMACLDGAPRSASVETIERSEICIVPNHEFQRVLLGNPSLAVELAKSMARRMRALTGSI